MTAPWSRFPLGGFVFGAGFRQEGPVVGLWRRQLRLSFRPGRRPWKLVRRPWSASSSPWAAWAAGGWFVRRRGSVASGAMSGRRSRKGVLAARLSGLLGQRQQRLPFRPGRRPRMLLRRPWSASGLPGAARAVGGRVVRRRGPGVGGGMSGRRPRKVVQVVSASSRAFLLVSCGRQGCSRCCSSSRLPGGGRFHLRRSVPYLLLP